MKTSKNSEVLIRGVVHPQGSTRLLTAKLTFFAGIAGSNPACGCLGGEKAVCQERALFRGNVGSNPTGRSSPQKDNYKIKIRRKEWKILFYLKKKDSV